jgi:hypothetical protein
MTQPLMFTKFVMMFSFERNVILLIFLWPISWLFAQDDCCNNTVDQSLLFEARLTGETFQNREDLGLSNVPGFLVYGDIILATGEKDQQ